MEFQKKSPGKRGLQSRGLKPLIYRALAARDPGVSLGTPVAPYKETGFRLCCELNNPNGDSVFGQKQRVSPAEAGMAS
jgi:hypothetical protein